MAGSGTVDADVQSDLVRLREEEKLARDVYLTMFDVWGRNIFENIAGSEQRHMGAVAVHLDALGITDPVVDDTVGVFTSPELGTLYQQLTKQGRESEVEALRVGALIEDLDIYDIKRMMSHTDDPDILYTYSKLLCGSGNHIRAYSRTLTAAGASYTPQFISGDDYAQILAAEHQRCGRN